MSQPTVNEPSFDRLVPGVAGPAESPGEITTDSATTSPIKLNRHSAKTSDPLAGAKKVKLMPLSLQESREDIDNQLDFLLATEKTEMVDLWEATLNNSPDIQFVVQRMQPTSNAAHATTILSRMLNAAIVGATGTMRVVAPSPGATALTQSGGSILSGILGAQDRKKLQKMNMSEDQLIILYKIVRDTADKLVENYRTYKRTVAGFQRAVADFADYRGMALDASAQNSVSQLEINYILRRQRRDIQGLRYDIRQHRQQLVDLAGPKATQHLDKQLHDEFDKTELALPAGATPWDDWDKEEQPGT